MAIVRSNPAKPARGRRAGSAAARRTVAVLAYDGLCLFEFGIAVELFGLPRPELDVPWYRCDVVATDARVRTAVGALGIRAPSGLERLRRAGTIVVPGWKSPDAAPSPALRNALRAAAGRGARFLTICSGAFLLAHCGLLDGRRATTHWRYERQFAARFPDVELVADVLYVEDGPFVTSAGSAAGIDAGLHLVRCDYGAAIANQVARRLVVPAHRDGGQRQFVVRPVPRVAKSSFDAAIAWARSRLDRAVAPRDMAKAAAMSERNFYRRFRETTGQTPAQWLLAERVQHARTLIETTPMPLPRVGEAAGFASHETFRVAFRRIVGIPPAAYRRTFGLRQFDSGVRDT